MRRLAALSLGLALAAPIAARADGPDQQAFQHPLGQQLQMEQAQGFTTHYGGHICAECARKLPKRIGADGPNAAPPPTVVAGAEGCASCGNGNMVMADLPPGAVIVSTTETPGVAYVGGEAPGMAYVGGPISADPAPIGVMRTDYQTGAPTPAMGASYGAGAPGMMPYANPAAGAAMPYGEPPRSHSMSYPGHRRTSILAHMLGLPRFGSIRARREAQQRDAHAAISYGNSTSGPESLPSSMVYGNR